MVSVSLVATPSYAVAILLLYFFAVRLGWFLVLGAGDAGNLLDQLHHLVLPTIALAVGWIGYIVRLVRSSPRWRCWASRSRTARAMGCWRRGRQCAEARLHPDGRHLGVASAN